MNYSIKMTAKAENGLVETMARYAEQGALVQSMFESELDRIISNISRNPNQFPSIEPPFRQALVKKFSYRIIYEVEGKTVIIYQVFSTRQNPKKMYDRT